MRHSTRAAWTLLLFLLAAAALPAIDRNRTVVLKGHVHPYATALNDRGPVVPGFAMNGLTLHLKRSAAQQRDLERLLEQQRNPASPNYRQWLTPEQFADRFGARQGDVDRIAAWLRSEGFDVPAPAGTRTYIHFSGTAALARKTFHTDIRRYELEGKPLFANSFEPSIPAELEGIVGAIGGLENLSLAARTRPLAELPRAANSHLLTPDDLAVIYDIAPLYAQHIDGSGQTLAVVGMTSIDPADIQTFRDRFGLPAQVPKVMLVPNRTDPGRVNDNLAEADLDIEWAGAVARNATILYVYSQNFLDAIQYVVDQKLATVISGSFGACEPQVAPLLPILQGIAQQANAEGITWVNAAGDAGAAGCDHVGAAIAQNGPVVSMPGSIPEVTAVGGTQFDSSAANYWNGSATATGYIQETAWSSVTELNALWAGAGGASTYFSKPVWQAGNGVPNDGARDVPDLALAASFVHDGYSGQTAGQAALFGGTSVAAPVFAGIVALANQYLVTTGARSQAGLGNINPALYRLAQTPGVFHDITSGNNIVPCAGGSPSCSGGSYGYSAGTGYDLVTGLGSPDVYNLLQAWKSQPAKKSVIYASVNPDPVYQQAPDAGGYRWSFSVTLKEEAGISTTLTDFTIDGVSYAAQITGFFGHNTIPANGSITAPLGFKNAVVPRMVPLTFSGVDADKTPWTQTITVLFTGPSAVPVITGAGNAASGQSSFAPGMLMSVYGSLFSSAPAQKAATIPLLNYMAGFQARINGLPAPLYYVSPTQVNLQIPYETAVGPATLVVTNGQDVASYSFQVAASAPGIFMDANGAAVPYPSGARGQVYVLFVTGEGQVLPALATGTTPAPATAISNLPAPRGAVTMTVGGATVQRILFAGIPSGLAGVTQINFVIPADAPFGVQPLIVTVGGVPSPPVHFTVTQ